MRDSGTSERDTGTSSGTRMSHGQQCCPNPNRKRPAKLADFSLKCGSFRGRTEGHSQMSRPVPFRNRIEGHRAGHRRDMNVPVFVSGTVMRGISMHYASLGAGHKCPGSGTSGHHDIRLTPGHFGVKRSMAFTHCSDGEPRRGACPDRFQRTPQILKTAPALPAAPGCPPRSGRGHFGTAGVPYCPPLRSPTLRGWAMISRSDP